jgi:hypothetical protein
MADLKGFVRAVSSREVDFTDKKTGEIKKFVVRSFNVEGVWLQVNDKSISLPDKGRKVYVSFHPEQTAKVVKNKASEDKRYYTNLVVDGLQYVQ